MELVNQEDPPEISDLILIDETACGDFREVDQDFEIPQKVLRKSVVVFVLSHVRVGPIVKLEIKLTLPSHQFIAIGFGIFKELVACGEFDFWESIKVSHAREALDMVQLRTTASVSVTEEQKCAVSPTFITEIFDVVQHLFD